MAASNQNLVVTAFWETNPGEEGAIANLLKDFLPQAQQEPGVKEFEHIEAAGILLLRGVRGRGRLRGPSANRALQEHHRRARGSETGETRTVPVPVHLTSERRSKRLVANRLRRLEPRF